MRRAVFGCLMLLVSVCWVGAAPQAARPAPPSSTPARPAPAPSAAQVRAQSPAQSPAEAIQSVFDRDSLTPDYRVAPGEVLQVFVWKEPDLSREVRVRPDGYMTVPLIGDIFVVGKTPRGLAAELAQQLGQYLTDPVVTVTLQESIALRFFVVGEVGKPGEFPLLGRTTVMQAFALAGGFREYAKTDEVKILRQELQVTGGRARTQETVVAVNYKALAQGQNLQQDLVLKPGDVIVVP
jgi:polysaccharide biosynthesis/export protein